LKTLSLLAALRTLRGGPLWDLLAADKGPAYVAMLHTLLMDQEKVLLSSVLHERLDRELDLLRAHGHDLPQTAQAYVADWLARGWLTRRFPPGAAEEEFGLTAEASTALRFITGVLKPRAKATESRLATVIEQLLRLAEETDANPKSRMETLHEERDRIDRELESIQRDGVKTLPDDRAVERAREIIALTDELGADFRKVREQFDKLNRELRKSLMENEGSRGAVLFQLFADRYFAGPNGYSSRLRVKYNPVDPTGSAYGLADPVSALKALSVAAEECRKLYGSLDVKWGDVHRFASGKADLPGNGGAGNSGVFRTIAYTRREGNRYYAAQGDTFVCAIEFAGTQRAQCSVSYGNASQPGSPHMEDQLPLMSAKKLHPVWREKKEVLAHLENRKQF